MGMVTTATFAGLIPIGPVFMLDHFCELHNVQGSPK